MMAVYTIDACYQVQRFVRHEIEAKDGNEALEKIKQKQIDDDAQIFWAGDEECEDSAGPVWFELIAVKPEPV
jgi:hypothetical protein